MKEITRLEILNSTNALFFEYRKDTIKEFLDIYQNDNFPN